MLEIEGKREKEVKLEEILAVKRIAYALDNVVRVTTSIIKELRANLSVFTLLEGI